MDQRSYMLLLLLVFFAASAIMDEALAQMDEALDELPCESAELNTLQINECLHAEFKTINGKLNQIYRNVLNELIKIPKDMGGGVG